MGAKRMLGSVAAVLVVVGLTAGASHAAVLLPELYTKYCTAPTLPRTWAAGMSRTAVST